METESQGRSDKMKAAWDNANAVPGQTLAARVEMALHRSYGVEALRAVRYELQALDPMLAATFWRLCGSNLDDTHEKRDLVEAVRAIEPKPAQQPVQSPAPVESYPAWAINGPDALSAAIEATYKSPRV